MRILCSNDDGIHSPGLIALEEIARELSDDVWTVAPEVDQSGMSRSITLTRPLRVRDVGEQRFAVDGTPTDCVQLGISHLVEGQRPDLILSGINNGQNIAEDVTVSGTIAVAFQGMTVGIPSIALSQSRSDRDAPKWHTAVAHGPEIIRRLLKAGWPSDVVINLNFPDVEPDEVAGIDVVAQGQREKVELYAEERTDLRQRRYYWFGFSGEKTLPPPDTDLRAIHDGKIAITPLHLALTHEDSKAQLRKVFSDL
ncbi:5'/3'-nucleotidase SurE [Parvularcula sp. LCG005]|uniref:5'/3'-nucleotidase SurE n=1 Tax=Parvularcula sp. LCG005 TaxID=3078805 RepID=UPI0029435C26|nr:5'/3'-nucleotidase SurE [Parvularcula sp. LCG005]WOI52367.1 5'/3'-nucleotidase SurE [Parvularcula sp. LCG005]